MAKKRRPTKLGDLALLLCLGTVAYYGYPPRLNPVAWACGVPAVLLFWMLFLMPTKCDYLTTRRKPCDRGVRGKVGGCRDHARWKRDAMFAAFGRRNPGQRFRIAWSAQDAALPPAPVRQTRDGERQSANASRGSYNLVMLIATVVSALAALAALLPR
ncbi:hypothetical protein [Kribbella albertanoniae]|uniref:Uncharacterized protein n=1 Tax=Kribbella albertanoniae TaxID=1266829 RepID=A0A4V2XRB5_9ACTN|nr:hypothetical protein [Kribbella albertanoniae]TDC29265.1 hypothetical protein E1261_16135 [Kribbella albertanoniae]